MAEGTKLLPVSTDTNRHQPYCLFCSQNPNLLTLKKPLEIEKEEVQVEEVVQVEEEKEEAVGRNRTGPAVC